MKREPVDRRQQIVNAAHASFTTNGYDGTTVGELAKTLGVSKAAINYYFPTKALFLDEFITPVLQELDDVIGPLAHTGNNWPTDSEHALTQYLTILTSHLDVARWMNTDIALANHPKISARLENINRQLLGIIANRSRKKVDKIRALAVLGGVWQPVHSLEADDLRNHIDEIVEAALLSYAPLDPT